MIEERFGEKKFSSRGMYIRNIADIIPNWSDICITADIPELSAIACFRKGWKYEENANL